MIGIARSGAVAASRPNGKTVLLMHMDGANGSAVFTDVKGHAVTAVGNAQISTAQSQFGGASAVFDGVGDYLNFNQHADFDFASGALTLELWFRGGAGNVTSNRVFQSRDGDVVCGLYLSYNTATQLQFNHSLNGTSFVGAGLNINVTTGVWHHLAITRNATTGVFTAWKDGVSQGSYGGVGALFYNVTHKWVIGGQSTPNRTMIGNIDEIRFTKGRALYTAPFTPPVAAFADV